MSPRTRFSLQFATAALILYFPHAILFFSIGGPVLTLAVGTATFATAYLISPLTHSSLWLRPRTRGGIVGITIAMLGHFGGCALTGLGVEAATVLMGSAFSFARIAENTLFFTAAFIFVRVDLLLWLPLGYALGRKWLPLQERAAEPKAPSATLSWPRR